MDMDIIVGKQWPALAGFGACYSIRKFSEISGKHCSFATMVKEGVLKDVGEEYAKHNATECNVFRGSETCLVAPDYSDYIKSSDSKNRPVDCAFKAFLTKSSF